MGDIQANIGTDRQGRPFICNGKIIVKHPLCGSSPHWFASKDENGHREEYIFYLNFGWSFPSENYEHIECLILNELLHFM